MDHRSRRGSLFGTVPKQMRDDVLLEVGLPPGRISVVLLPITAFVVAAERLSRRHG